MKKFDGNNNRPVTWVARRWGFLVLVGLAFVLGCACACSAAHAQDSAAADSETKGPWTFNMGANAILNTGNSNNQTFGGDKLLAWEKERNKVSWKSTGAFGRAEVSGVTETVTNNLKTQLRYDRGLSDHFGLFGQGNIGYDKPAGFDLRAGAALGATHTVIKNDVQRFNYELGPDFTHEERTNGTQDDIISARGFVEYEYKFSKDVRAGQNVEALLDVENTDDVRINAETKVTAKMTSILSLKVAFNLRADLEPVPGFEEVDTTTTVGLVFDIL